MGYDIWRNAFKSAVNDIALEFEIDEGKAEEILEKRKRKNPEYLVPFYKHEIYKKHGIYKAKTGEKDGN